MRQIGSALGVVTSILADTETPIGARLVKIAAIRDAVHRVERQLLMQLGADAAKEMAALGFAPQGRPIGELLAESEPARCPCGDRRHSRCECRDGDAGMMTVSTPSSN